MDSNFENTKLCCISDYFVFVFNLVDPQWLHAHHTMETEVIKTITQHRFRMCED